MRELTAKILCACAAAAVLAASDASAQTAQPGEMPRLVTMTGQGIVQGTPDRAWVTLGVEVRDPQTAAAQEKVAVAMDHIQQRLKSLGIADAAIRTSAFNVEQDWEFLQGGRRLRGYVVSNQIEVRVDDIARVSGVLNAAIAAGANIVHGIRWDIKDRRALEQQALKLAFEDASARAEVIATASGRSLGPVQDVQENRSGDMRPMPSMMRMRAGSAGAVAENLSVAVNPGEIDVRSVVTVTFRLR